MNGQRILGIDPMYEEDDASEAEAEAAFVDCFPATSRSDCTTNDWKELVDDAEPSDKCALCMLIHAESTTYDQAEDFESWYDECGLKPPRCPAADARTFGQLDACIAGTTGDLDNCIADLDRPTGECENYCTSVIWELWDPTTPATTRDAIEDISSWCDPAKAPININTKTSGATVVASSLATLAFAIVAAM